MIFELIWHYIATKYHYFVKVNFYGIYFYDFSHELSQIFERQNLQQNELVQNIQGQNGKVDKFGTINKWQQYNTILIAMAI